MSVAQHERIACEALAGAVETQTDVGPILLHGRDEVITPALRDAGTWEPGLRAAVLADLRPGAMAADVGANVGYFALAMAEAVGPSGRVIAVEPDPANLALLRENARRTRGAPIEVVAAAAWDRPGRLRLTRCEQNTGDHRIEVRADEREVVEVEAVALDDILPPRLDVLLLDTQATEHVALRSARRLLTRGETVVFAEFWPLGLREAGTDPLAVLAEYRAAGLSVSLVEAPGLDAGADDEAILAATLAIEPERFGTLRMARADGGSPLRRARRRLAGFGPGARAAS